MEQLNWTEEAKKDWLQSFVDTLRKVLHISKEKSGEELDKELIALGKSEEEKRLIQQHIEEIDLYYEKLAALKKAKKQNPELTNEQWLIEEVKNEINNVNKQLNDKNLNEEEAATVELEMQKVLDEEIINQASMLSQEMDELTKEVE